MPFSQNLCSKVLKVDHHNAATDSPNDILYQRPSPQACLTRAYGVSVIKRKTMFDKEKSLYFGDSNYSVEIYPVIIYRTALGVYRNVKSY